MAAPEVIFEASHTDAGLFVNFYVPFELSPAVEGALQKGVALNFVAEVEVFRRRWYWRDVRIANAVQNWRLSFQPLTRQYRVTIGLASQNTDTLPEALAWLQSTQRLAVADASQLDSSHRYWLQLTYQLDTTHLPRPLQIGIGGQSDWAMRVQKTLPLPPRTVAP